MKTKILLIASSLCFSILWSQKKKPIMDITSNAEARVIWMKGIGNNFLAKDFNDFYGVGVGGQLMTPINFGLELNYNLMFSSVKYGHENIVGNLGSQKLSEINLNIVHKNNLTENLSIEESVGFSILRLNSSLYPEKESYSEGRGGLNLQLKGVYTLDNEGTQQFVLGIKGNTFSSGTVNQNPDIQKYYRTSFLIGITAAYRYNF